MGGSPALRAAMAESPRGALLRELRGICADAGADAADDALEAPTL